MEIKAGGAEIKLGRLPIGSESKTFFIIMYRVDRGCPLTDKGAKKIKKV